MVDPAKGSTKLNWPLLDVERSFWSPREVGEFPISPWDFSMISAVGQNELFSNLRAVNWSISIAMVCPENKKNLFLLLMEEIFAPPGM